MIDFLLVEKGIFVFQLASNDAVDMLQTGKWRFNEKSMWQALHKVARFVHGQVLPRVVAEAGCLCTAAVYASLADAVPQLGALMDPGENPDASNHSLYLIKLVHELQLS